MTDDPFRTPYGGVSRRTPTLDDNLFFVGVPEPGWAPARDFAPLFSGGVSVPDVPGVPTLELLTTSGPGVFRFRVFDPSNGAVPLDYLFERRQVGSTVWEGQLVLPNDEAEAVFGESAVSGRDADYEWRCYARLTPSSTGAAATGIWHALPDAPAQVTGMVAQTITQNSVAFDWADATGADTYRFEYRKASDTAWIPAGGALASSNYTVSGLTANTAYVGRAWGVNAGGAGPVSATLNATTLAAPVTSSRPASTSDAISAIPDLISRVEPSLASGQYDVANTWLTRVVDDVGNVWQVGASKLKLDTTAGVLGGRQTIRNAAANFNSMMVRDDAPSFERLKAAFLDRAADALSQLTVVLAYRPTTAGSSGYRGWFAANTSDNKGAFQIVEDSADTVGANTRVQSTVSGSTKSLVDPGPTTLGADHCLIVRHDSTNLHVLRDGLLAAQSTTVLFGKMSTFSFAQLFDGGQGHLAAFFLFRRALTDAELEVVRGYVNANYGFSLSAFPALPAPPTPNPLPPEVSIYPAYTQQVVWPTVAVGAGDAVLPADGVQLLNPVGTCALNLDFRTGGNCRNHATLFSACDYLAPMGTLNSATEYVRTKGFVPKMFSTMARYPETYADGTTPDPRNLHKFLSSEGGFLRLCGRGTGNDFLEMSKVEAGMIVPIVGIKSGMYVELRCRFPAERGAWPAFWGFDVFVKRQASAAAGYPYSWASHTGRSLEIDWIDGYSLDGQPGGTLAPIAPVYPFGSGSTFNTNVDAEYGNPAATPPYTYPQDTFRMPPQTSGVDNPVYYDVARPYSQYKTRSPNLAERFFTVAFDWTDRDTWQVIIDGKVVKRKRLFHKANFPAKDASGRATPEPGPYGQTVTNPDGTTSWQGNELLMSAMIGCQVGATFNPQDMALLPTLTGADRWKFDLQWLRIWNSPSTLQPVGPSADLTLNPRV